MTSPSISLKTKPRTDDVPYSSRPFWQQFIRRIEWRLALLPVLGMVLFWLWKSAAESGRYAAFFLPHPAAVYDRLVLLWHNDTLLVHLSTTLWEALAGLFIATVVALPLGYLIARLPLFDYLLTPYLIFLQAIPVVAIAPLIIIWFNAGLTSKIVIAAMITWFPLLIATIVGIRNIPPNLREMMRANTATLWQTFWHLEVPAALPQLLGGFKIAVTLAVIGAAVGEFVSSTQGLGYLVVFGRGTSDTALVIGAIFLLTAISFTLYGLVAWLEHALLAWQRAGR